MLRDGKGGGTELGIYAFTSIARWRNDDGVGCSVGGEEIGY
jgi:hypothetical protein